MPAMENQRLPRTKNVLMIVHVLALALLPSVWCLQPLVARCPTETDQNIAPEESSYCQCVVNNTRSGNAITILCDFRKERVKYLTTTPD